MTVGRATAARLLDAGPRYRLLRALGEGSFGAVYRARLVEWDQEVAIKALTRVKPDALARFKREFRALSNVSHANLVALQELFEHEGQWFIAMDLVEGTDLMSWVRKSANDNGFDEGRLRKSFADVAQGLSALHAHGLLHRDLKPSNVRVTPEGKAVVLDFGLVTMVDEGLQSTHRNSVGTLAYMAPEQLGGEKLSPAADLYALGTSLYEALTGRLPFEADTAFALMLRKTNEDAPAPSRFVPGLPAELDALCVALLDRNPKQRPSIENVLRTLLGALVASRSLVPARSSAGADDVSVSFEGREAEIEQLNAALARTHEGELSLVFIEGESGIGKSALVSEFARRQLEAQPASWVLWGRCYEHERVPYKAFDACMDALAKRLGRLAPELCHAVLPRRAGLLAELFPVLGAVKALAESPTHGAPAEPAARRLEAFNVAADLLAKLAESRPLLLLIDDLQWADEESLRLLRHLVRERPPPVLLVATVRPGRELSPPVYKALTELRDGASSAWLHLHGLPQEAIESLARKVLDADAFAAAIHQISYESAGHPMLVAELCYHAKTRRGPAQRLTLSAALTARIASLSAPARRLLEALALCGRPHSEALFRSLDLATAFADALAELLAQRFARRSTGQMLAIAHDRVRGVVIEQLEAERAVGLHDLLARALEARREGDAFELAEHWGRAGETLRAGALYLESAKLAMAALAFGSAADHYARAFDLLGDDRSAERGAWLTQYGRALAGAGRSAEAATAFTRAAECVAGAERIRLRIWAAQHQLQSAQLEEGIRNAREVLEELDVPVPSGKVGTLARIVWERGALALRGFSVEVKSEFDAHEKLRLDAMTDLSFPLWWADFLPGNALTIMHLRRALALGEPGHAACALAQEGALRAILADHKAAPSLFSLARELAERSELPSARARVALGEGVAAYMRGDLEQALAKCFAAEELLVSSCPGEVWLLTNVRMTLGMALSFGGHHLQLAASFGRWLAEARARKDVFAQCALVGLGHGYLPSLMGDRPDEASELLESSMEPWLHRPTDVVLMGEAHAQFDMQCYAGGSQLHAWFDRRRACHERAFLFQRGEGRSAISQFRATAALAAHLEAHGARRRELLVEAKAAARTIERSSGFGAVTRRTAFAQIYACAGDLERAISAAREAVEVSRRTGQGFLGSSPEYLLGVLEGGEGGKEHCEAALAYFRERGWKDPWRAATMYVPVARTLDSTGALRVKSTPLFLGRFRLSVPLPATDREALADALDTRTGRSVTLRSLGRPEPALLRGLKEQLRALERVHHENLARSESLHDDDGRLILVLERIPALELLAYVRPNGQLDEARLRATLSQVLAALGALHDADAAHGELRASLLRVGETGRVVVLGPGALGARVGRADEEPEDLDYLAPEQLEGAGPSAAADMFALGTSLYQALTGQLPFDRLTSEKVREAKQCGRPVPPWALRLAVPGDLEELCLSMLERDPSQRPSVREARACLAGSLEPGKARAARSAKALASLSPPTHVSTTQQHSFIGRARELALLHAELLRAAQGAQVLLCVRGEGGIGKTALVREALSQLATRVPEARVLRSRCYANEQLRLQAFDGAVDELAQLLSKRPQRELEALLPARAALLAQLFPVLASVPLIRGATKKGLPAEPAARRGAAIATFVELVMRLSRHSLLVLVIDDLQWADAESFALLSALLGAGSESGAARLAIVALLRPEEARDQAAHDALAELQARPSLVRLDLAKLAHEDARSLARHLFGAAPGDAELELAVHESGGHPLFLGELAHARQASGSAANLNLEQVLWQRVTGLAPDARTLLALLALLARPCPAHVLERAAGLGRGFEEALRGLLCSGLVERRGPLGLACFHDRLREVVAEHAESGRGRLCAQLAEALEAEAESDPAERARLLDVAGDVARACAAYAAAGDQALEALSFATADRLYGRALELAESTAEAPLARLLGQRAHALVALARSAEAAALFERAAQHADGADAVRLRVWAAQHQIQSAQFDDGLRNARAVLKELDVSLPETDKGALARIAWERALLALRVGGVHVSSTIGARDKLRLDALSGLIFPMLWADFLPGTALNMTHLRRALGLGDPSHAARALAQEGALRAMMDDEAGAAPLLSQASALAMQSDVPSAVAFVSAQHAAAALMRGDLEAALNGCLETEELLLTSCPEEAWLLTNVRMTMGIVFSRAGEYPQLYACFKRWFDEARARRDAFATNALFGLGFGYMTFLMDGRVEEALAEAERLMAPWRARPAGFAQAGELFAQSYTFLYQGGAQAYAWFLEHREALQRSFFLRRGETHMAMLFARASGALSARAAGLRRDELLTEVTAIARRIARRGYGIILQPLIQAQLAALAGDEEAARHAGRSAEAASIARGELAFAQNAGYLLGVLEGGEGGRARCEASLAFFRERGWKDPWRAATMYVPAARELEGKAG